MTLTPRVATSTVFLCLGVAFGTWASRLAEVKRHIHASNGALGLTLSAVTVGSILSMTLVGGALGRFGSRRMTMVGTAGMVLVLPTLALVHTAPELAALLFAYGVAIAWTDVSMNTQAVLVEQRAGRPLMSGFHAWFSVGGLVGAATSALAASALAPGAALCAHRRGSRRLGGDRGARTWRTATRRMGTPACGSSAFPGRSSRLLPSSSAGSSERARRRAGAAST